MQTTSQPLTLEEIYRIISREFSLPNLKRLAYRIYDYEKTFCNQDFLKSSQFCYRELAKTGSRNVQRIPLKADGRTAYLDFILPEAWDVDEAWCDLLDAKGRRIERLCDRKRTLFCVAKRCASTHGKTIVAELIPWEIARQKTCLAGKMVFTNLVPQAIKKELVAKQALGMISSWAEGGAKLPEGVAWHNEGQLGPGWHHTQEDPKIICFFISPAAGVRLARTLQRHPGAQVALFVKSRLYAGTRYSVTGLLPGATPQEILFLAHLYEPMLSDNAIGGASLIEISRLLHRCLRTGALPPLQRGIRFLMSMERYGFAQYFCDAGRTERILAATSVDSIGDDPHKTGEPIRMRYSPLSRPFFGDGVLDALAEQRLAKRYPYQLETGNFSDDTWIADGTLGIPTNWLWSPPGPYHHNSLAGRAVNWDVARQIAALIATNTYALASSAPELPRLLLQQATATAQRRLREYHRQWKVRQERGLVRSRRDVRRCGQFYASYLKRMLDTSAPFGADAGQLARSKRRLLALHRQALAKQLAAIATAAPDAARATAADARAAELVIKRKSRGIPFSLAQVPYEARKKVPLIPELLLSVLSWADGKRTLAQLFRQVEWELEQPLAEASKKMLLDFVLLLGRYHYLDVAFQRTLGRADIQNGLRRLGIRAGDAVIVHSSLSRLGRVAGGPAAVCRALMGLITKKGTLLMPSFNHGAAFAKGTPGYYSPRETPTTNGAIADAFWRMPGVHRSLDPIHAVSAWGRDARALVKDHHKVITMGENSPIQKLEQRDGKVVLIDAPFANTFQHVVEMTNRVPCLGRRTVEYPVKLPSGKMVKCRTWGWRNQACPYIDEKPYYLERMREQGQLREGYIGQAHVIVFSMRDCRRAVEELLHGRRPGLPGCRTCPIRPLKQAADVPSDWDEARQQVKPETTAFVGAYLT